MPVLAAILYLLERGLPHVVHIDLFCLNEAVTVIPWGKAHTRPLYVDRFLSGIKYHIITISLGLKRHSLPLLSGELMLTQTHAVIIIITNT